MSRQLPNFHTVSTVTGSLLVASGLFILFANLLWAADQGRRLLHSMGAGFGVLSSVMLASSFRQQQLVDDVFHVLWPLLLVALGSVLLRTASSHLNRPANTKGTFGSRERAASGQSFASLHKPEGAPSKLCLGGGVRPSQTADEFASTFIPCLGTEAVPEIRPAPFSDVQLLSQGSEVSERTIARHLCRRARKSAAAVWLRVYGYVVMPEHVHMLVKRTGTWGARTNPAGAEAISRAPAGVAGSRTVLAGTVLRLQRVERT